MSSYKILLFSLAFFFTAQLCSAYPQPLDARASLAHFDVIAVAAATSPVLPTTTAPSTLETVIADPLKHNKSTPNLSQRDQIIIASVAGVVVFVALAVILVKLRSRVRPPTDATSQPALTNARTSRDQEAAQDLERDEKVVVIQQLPELARIPEISAGDGLFPSRGGNDATVAPSGGH